MEKYTIKKFEDYVIQVEPTDTKKAVQEIALKNVDIMLLNKLYDIVDRFTPRAPMREKVKLTTEEKHSLLTAAFCQVVNKEKYKRAIDDIVEECRLRGCYKELMNCKHMMDCCFSVAMLLKSDPIKSIKQPQFIDTLCNVFKEYEIHFDDCELLASHYYKGDVSGDCQVVFNAIKEKMPKLIK
jgi:hypothetical protein